jgi:hypothetical protein
MENCYYYTFALLIPLELDDEYYVCLKFEHYSWVPSLGEDSQIVPPLSISEKTSLGTSSHVHYHQMNDKIETYDLFEMLILNLHFVSINLSLFLVFIMMMS